MPHPQSDNRFQVAIMIPDAWMKMVNDIAAPMARPSLSITRVDALRAALADGLQPMCEREVKRPRTTKPAKSVR